MLKDVVSKLDYSTFDEIALVLFASAFLVIIWGAFRLSKDATDRFSAIPLSDAVQDPFTKVSSTGLKPLPLQSTQESTKKDIPKDE